MSEITLGNNITIYEHNKYYSHVSSMLLEHFDNENYIDNVFILGGYVSNSCSYFREKFAGKKLIAYQMEQIMGIDPKTGKDTGGWHSVKKIVENLRGYDEIWDIDELNEFALSWFDIKVNRIVHPKYTKKLDRVSSLKDPKIDILFYGFMNDRRFKIIKMLESAFYDKLSIIWIYGTQDIDHYIANSKVILNIHAFEPWNRQEQIRMFYPVINGKTVISEVSQKNYMEDLIVEVSLGQIANVLLEYCNTDKWLNFGKEAREKFINFNNI